MIMVTIRFIKRAFVVLAGFTILLAGVVMLVTPGPGVAVIVVGLSILATEIVWARVLLARLKDESLTYTRGFTAWLKKHLKSERK